MTYAYVLYDGYRGDITSKIIDSLLQDISKLLVCEIFFKNVPFKIFLFSIFISPSNTKWNVFFFRRINKM